MSAAEKYFIDSSNMPLVLGNALRVPDYAYPAWGIAGSEEWLRKESDKQYEIEWKGGSPRQMQYVVEAITESGLGNYSQMLRDANAELVSKIVNKSKKRVNYLELGAGISTVTVYQKLISNNIDVEKVFGTLIEPSESRIEDTAKKLEGLGLKQKKNFKIIVARDLDIPMNVDINSQDIASYVAVLHHHAYLDTPLKAVYDSLKPNGYLIIADWHNTMWEHPSRIYEFLNEEFIWNNKERDLDNFVEMFPNALNETPEQDPLYENANINIKKFWKSYANIRKKEIEKGNFKAEDDIWMLEAHRPVEKQNQVLRSLGYELDGGDLQNPNPRRLVEDAGILYVTLAQKI